MPTREEFRNAIRSKLRHAELKGVDHLDLNAGELHRELGGYPSAGGAHQMPSCCEALHAEQRTGDVVLARPPKGKGASLTIRFKLPR